MSKKLFVCFLLASALLCSGFSSVAAAPGVPNTLIRLHILANSESLEDQQAKMIVRDELLAWLSPRLQGVGSLSQAEEIITASLAELTKVADLSLARQGKDYLARVQFGIFNFPDKHYGTFTLPAGRYPALNVTLGQGAGRNWWCVVFPPLCLTSGVCQLNKTEEQTFVLHSYLLEWWDRLYSWMSPRS